MILEPMFTLDLLTENRYEPIGSRGKGNLNATNLYNSDRSHCMCHALPPFRTLRRGRASFRTSYQRLSFFHFPRFEKRYDRPFQLLHPYLMLLSDFKVLATKRYKSITEY